MEPAIVVRDLSRRFGDRPALDRVSFQVMAGEVFGVLGPNGAGKTTTVRLLNGLLQPDGGTMQVWGLDPARAGEQVRQRSGVLTETPSLYDRLSAYENLRFFGTLYGVPERELPGRIEQALRSLGLWERAGEKAGGYSKGMKQRLAIARAILHDPPLLYLDEPTSGLDPEAAEQVLQLISDLRAQGRTVFLCTHRLNEAERVCDRFALFSQGRLLACGTKQELERSIWEDEQVTLQFLDPVPELPPVAGMTGREVAGDTLTATVTEQAVIPQVVKAAVEAGGRILSVKPVERPLEAIYFAMVKRSREATT